MPLSIGEGTYDKGMNNKYVVNETHNRLEITLEGEASLEGLSDFVEGLIKHPDWYPGRKVLIDFKKFFTITLTNDDVMNLSLFVRSLKNALGDGACAIYVSRDIDFGIVRMWQMHTENDINNRIEVFDSREEASGWLDQQQ